MSICKDDIRKASEGAGSTTAPKQEVVYNEINVEFWRKWSPFIALIISILAFIRK